LLLQGARDRLNPILMTALATALALVPLAINGEAAGNEIQNPMAVVILGGLLTSTFLNLFVVPAVCTMVSFPADGPGSGAGPAAGVGPGAGVGPAGGAGPAAD
jgi:Cu/Ag efflux pump CusA